MHIHRPKPFHSVRELLTEISVIVIGIAIALGGEQVVQWLDRRAEAADARQALRSEIAANVGGALTTIEAERCDGETLDRYVAWANGGPRPPFRLHELFEPQTSTWEAVQAGAVAHMPLKERRAYAWFYNIARAMTGNTELEIPLLLQLGGQSAKAALTPANAQRLLEDAAQLRVIGTIRHRNALAMIQAAKAMGIRPEPMPAKERAALGADCGPLGIAPIPPTP